MPNELWIYDVIGESFWESGVTSKGVRDELAEMDSSEKLTVRINSPGGDVFHAVAIRTLLSEWEAGVDVKIDGLAASAASFIATVGDTVSIAEGSMYMIHDPWTVAIGNAQELTKAVARLEKIGDSIRKIYEWRTSKTSDELKAAMQAETWLTADEALEWGFADSKSGEKAADFAIPQAMGYKNAPQPSVVLPKQRSFQQVGALQRRIDLARSV